MSRILPNRGRQGSSSNGESRVCHEFCHLCDGLTAIDKLSHLLVYSSPFRKFPKIREILFCLPRGPNIAQKLSQY